MVSRTSGGSKREKTGGQLDEEESETTGGGLDEDELTLLDLVSFLDESESCTRTRKVSMRTLSSLTRKRNQRNAPVNP